MRFRSIFLVLLLSLFLFSPFQALFSAESTSSIEDLTKAYEVWKGHGIKFVIRGSDGQFLTWGVGRLESWNNESTWVVRDPKGRFLTKAIGRVETWKTGATRLVLRDKKGHLLTHLNINLTSKASFSRNVVGLRRLSGDNKFLAFVQETLAELLVKEMKTGDTLRVKVLVDYIKKNKNMSGMSNFKPVLKIAVQQLNFMTGQNPSPNLAQLAADARYLMNYL
ncbi:MAG: hypothetical protein WA705_15420 [Candidatus Ozemobacteraceae bacterium]